MDWSFTISSAFVHGIRPNNPRSNTLKAFTLAQIYKVIYLQENTPLVHEKCEVYGQRYKIGGSAEHCKTAKTENRQKPHNSATAKPHTKNRKSDFGQKSLWREFLQI